MEEKSGLFHKHIDKLNNPGVEDDFAQTNILNKNKKTLSVVFLGR